MRTGKSDRPLNVSMTPIRKLVYEKLDDLYERASEDELMNPAYRSLMRDYIKFVVDVKKEIDKKISK